jgi:hypothetical protein
LDEAWERQYAHLGRLVRYCDDFVVLCRRPSQAREALQRVGEILGVLGLRLHPGKTRLVQEYGLYQLLGTIRYPGAAHAT